MSHSQPNGGWINGKAENLGEPKFKGKTRKSQGRRRRRGRGRQVPCVCELLIFHTTQTVSPVGGGRCRGLTKRGAVWQHKQQQQLSTALLF